MRRVAFGLWVLACLILMQVLAVPYGPAIGGSLEDAVLKGDWQGVVQTLEKDDKGAGDPVARLLMGHACLASNRNNESLLLFLSAKDEKDLNRWSEWTDSLLCKNRQNPVALYLSADAKARTGRFNEAMGELTAALRMKGTFALALSARGVVRLLSDEEDEALMDFYQATKLAPDFADAHASLGTYWILSESPEGALEAFNNAIALNPEFALAYNGRGCAYFGQGKFEEGAAEFWRAAELCPVFVVAEINQGFAYSYASQVVSLSAMEKRPGTTFESILEHHHQDILKRQHEAMAPLMRDRALLEMKPRDWALASPEKLHSLVSEYGATKVRTAGFLARQQLLNESRDAHREILNTCDKISLHNKIVYASSVADISSSLALSSSGLLKEATQGWKPLLRESIWEVGKASAEALASNRTSEAIIGAIGGPLTSALSSYSKLTRYLSEDARDRHVHHYEALKAQQDVRALQLRAMDSNLNRIGEVYRGKPSSGLKAAGPPTSIFVNPAQPLTDLGNLVSELNSRIPSSAQQPRQLSIVAGDESRFRADVLQQSLAMRGFETTVIPPEKVAEVLRQSPTQAMIGVDRNIASQTWDSWKFKTFSPTYPTGAPGGISTKEIARAFVDKGNWPVMTCFGLFYRAGPSTEGQK